MNLEKNIWDYLAMIPAALAAAGVLVFFVLALTDAVADGKLLIVAAFAFAEVTMILAGAGGVVYLINPRKTPRTRRWMWLDVALFFAAAATGLVLFMAL